MKSDIICLQIYEHRMKENYVKYMNVDEEQVSFDDFLFIKSNFWAAVNWWNIRQNLNTQAKYHEIYFYSPKRNQVSENKQNYEKTKINFHVFSQNLSERKFSVEKWKKSPGLRMIAFILENLLKALEVYCEMKSVLLPHFL